MSKHPTHLSTSVVESHRAEDGTLVVGRARLRTEQETARLRGLVRQLSYPPKGAAGRRLASEADA